MSPNPTHQNSGSEEEPQVMDQRKRKRMLSNRESARRSRMRKQQHLDELINQVSQLKNENNQISMQANLFMQQHTKLQSENSFLRTQMNGLAERLQSLNSVLRFVAESSGVPMDMPDPLLEPWQLTYLMQPIVASTDMF